VLHTPKAADSSGKASLAVDDTKAGGEEGASAALVVIKGTTILAKKTILIAQS
jgi:hypothetical protein